jgi:hypothetical protein
MDAVASFKPKVCFSDIQDHEKTAVSQDEILAIRGAELAKAKDKFGRIRLDVAAKVGEQGWGILVLHTEIPNLPGELSLQL